jgi:hypothetical protein
MLVTGKFCFAVKYCNIVTRTFLVFEAERMIVTNHHLLHFNTIYLIDFVVQMKKILQNIFVGFF